MATEPQRKATVKTASVVTVYQVFTMCPVPHMFIVSIHPRVHEENLIAVPILQMQKQSLAVVKGLFVSIQLVNGCIGIQTWVGWTPEPTLLPLRLAADQRLDVRYISGRLLLIWSSVMSLPLHNQTRPFRHCLNSTFLGLAHPCQVFGSKEVMRYKIG